MTDRHQCWIPGCAAWGPRFVEVDGIRGCATPYCPEHAIDEWRVRFLLYFDETDDPRVPGRRLLPRLARPGDVERVSARAVARRDCKPDDPIAAPPVSDHRMKLVKLDWTNHNTPARPARRTANADF